MMESCTLSLYKQNIFRVTGLPVDATAKEVSRQAQRLQMLEEYGGASNTTQPAFALSVTPTTDEIRNALSRMKEPESRIVDEFFWYWPEKFGASNEDPAIQAMLAGDSERAGRLWKDREKLGSRVAQHNMAVMYHMYAVDWTNYHVAADLDPRLDQQIKVYWSKAFERWQSLIESDDLWNMLKERVHSLNDEALTTGFVRRMQRNLPMALVRVNAEAALLLADQERMDWAKFHVDFMRQTHQGVDDVDQTIELVLGPSKRRVEQFLESFESEADKSPQKGAELAIQLLDRCRPIMSVFDLFYGANAHQRNDLFDKVAEMVLEIAVGYQKATGDDEKLIELLRKSLKIVTASSLRERINKNIETGERNLEFELLKPILAQIKNINDGNKAPEEKLKSLQKSVIPKIPSFGSKLGYSDAYSSLLNTLALTLREISINAYNHAKDMKTAELAIVIAHGIAVDKDIKNRIIGDLELIQNSTGKGVCFFCDSKHGDPTRSIKVPMHKITERMHNGLRYASNMISVPRCGECYLGHNKHWRVMWWGAAAGSVAGIFIVPWSAAVGAGMTALIAGGWLTRKISRNDSDGRLGCLGIFLTIGLIVGLWEFFSEKPIGENILMNMIGGAITAAFVTFWVAKKVIYESLPEDMAKECKSIITLAKDGWLPGAEP